MLDRFRELWRGRGPFVAFRIAWRFLPLLLFARWPPRGRRELRAVSRVIRSGNWGGFPHPNSHARILGERFARRHSAQFGICTSNGTSALLVAYQAAGLKRGDEIIVPALTFSATASAALILGIRPVFADVDERTMCLDPTAAKKLINPRTKAVVAVHLGSQVADLHQLRALCNEHGLRLIEDCAHAHGARWDNRGAGSLGDLGCFSFQSSKLMTSGEGGIVITSDRDLAARCHSYVNGGRLTRSTDAPFSFLGLNHRLTEIQASLLLAQLQRLEHDIERRHHNVRLLTGLLQEIEGIEALMPYPGVTVQVGYGFYFRFLPERCAGVSRDEFVRDLFDHGVPASPGQYLPVYQCPEFGWKDAPVDVDYSNTHYPVAERCAAHELVWLPHPIFRMAPKRMERIAKIIAGLTRSYRGRDLKRGAVLA